MFAILFISAQALIARHKDQVFFTNNYGQDVTIALNWKSNVYPYPVQYQEKKIKKSDKNLICKAPLSTSHLVKLIVTPTKNMPWFYSSSESIDLMETLRKTLNHHEVQNNYDHTFFVIEKTNNKSDIKKQDKIAVIGYASQEQYKNTTNKALTAQQDNLASEEKDIEPVLELSVEPIAEESVPVIHENDSNENDDLAINQALKDAGLLDDTEHTIQ